MLNFSFPNKDDRKVFIVSVKVNEGFYRGKWFRFKFQIVEGWPNEKPYVRIIDKIWHPNIGLISEDHPENGYVSVNTIDLDYNPVILLHVQIEALQYLLKNPFPRDAVNREAGNELENNLELFKKNVRRYLDEMPDE